MKACRRRPPASFESNLLFFIFSNSSSNNLKWILLCNTKWGSNCWSSSGGDLQPYVIFIVHIKISKKFKPSRWRGCSSPMFSSTRRTKYLHKKNVSCEHVHKSYHSSNEYPEESFMLKEFQPRNPKHILVIASSDDGTEKHNCTCCYQLQAQLDAAPQFS